MKKKRFFTFLKVLILLSPIPFGCVGRAFAPLFYVLLLFLSFYGINLIEHGRVRKLKFGEEVQGKGVKREEKNQQTNNKLLVGRNIYLMLYEKWIRRFLCFYLIFLVLQIIPMPLFLLKLLSPATVKTLAVLRDQVPNFFSISLVPLDTLIYGLKFLTFTLFFWVLLKIRMEKKDIVSIINTIILCSALQVVFGLIKYLVGNKYFFLFFHPFEKSGDVRRLTGTLGNTDHFAFFLEMILPLVISLLFIKINFFSSNLNLRERFVSAFNADKKVMGYVVVVLLLGTGIYLTGSRAGVVTMGLSFLIFAQLTFFLKQSSSVRRRLKLIFISFTLIAVFIGLQSTIGRFLSTRIESSGRFLRWPNTLEMVADYPVFGTGFGTYRYAYFLYDTDQGGNWSTHAHNDFLEVLSDGGVIGSILFFLLIGMIIYSIFRMWNERKHPVVKMIGIGILTSLFAVVFHSFFDFSLRIPSNVLIFVLILVLGVKIVTYKRDFGDRNVCG